MKRNYPPVGMGYAEGMPPPSKLAAPSYRVADYTQDDFQMGGTDNGNFAMYGQPDSQSYYSDMGAQQFGGGKPRIITDRLQSLTGIKSSTIHSNRSHEFQHRGGGEGYRDYGGAYDQVNTYNQNYGYEDYGYGDDYSDWSYNEGGGEDDYSGGGVGGYGGGGMRGGGGMGYASGGGGGQRGRGRGQTGRGQVRGRGGRGQSFDGGNQHSHGRGRGVAQPSRAGRGVRGWGRGSAGNFHNNSPYVEGNFSHQVRGRGGRGMGDRGRGRGNQRGRLMGRGSTAGQVKSVTDNILGMVRGGRGKDRGKGKVGRGGGGGVIGKPSSLMDIVDTAFNRKFGKTAQSSVRPEVTRFSQFLEFFLTSPDRVNGIQTLGNALTASRLSLQIEFEAEQLMFIIKPLFTGVLKIGGIFLTRGLGLSKKAVKHDCFERAVKILRESSLDEILTLEDCGKEALKDEVKRQSEEDYEAFKTFLSPENHSVTASDASVKQFCAQLRESNFPKQQKQAEEVETSDKIRTAAVTESQVAERNFPLSDKLMMLQKELEKSGLEMQDVAMASRFDVLCFKVGINVSALYRVTNLSDNRRFHTHPYKGDPDLELTCEIYYDGVKVGEGRGRPRKEAQIAAYNCIHQRLKTEAMSAIADGEKIPAEPEALPDYFEIIHKGAKPQSGNNHQRLYSLRTHPPDMNKSVDDMVIIETTGDNLEENAYKILEFSASKNSMLIEWKQLDKGNNLNGFRCEITINRKKTVTGIGPSKPKARNAAAAMLLMDMYLSHDVICHDTSDYLMRDGIPVSDITARAEALKAEGPPRTDRLDGVWPLENPAHKEKAAERSKERPGGSEDDIVAVGKKWMEDPLRPWLEDAILERLEAQVKKITLEELVIGPGISSGLRRFVQVAARHYLLGANVKVDPVHGAFICVHQRSVLPEEMAMILRINNKASGRFKLVRANKPVTVVQQAQFVRTFPDVWQARCRAQLEADKQRREEAALAAAAAAAAAKESAPPSDDSKTGVKK